jgi:hypothetical protein
MANERSDRDSNDEAERAVEEVIRAFEDLLPPDELRESRDLLLDVIAAHPLGRLLAERVRERRAIDHSREQPAGGGVLVESPEAQGAEASRQKGKATGERR